MNLALAKRGWYKALRFKSALVMSEDALLQPQRKNGSGKVIVATGVCPQEGCYYHPKVSNHPWIDRIFVALHPVDKEKCLVIIQDKVNASDFPSACAKLQMAADLLSEAHSFKQVLLIANVIGASEGTSAQSKFTWPYILVRGDEEVRKYYSVNFADIVLYARRRHLLSE